MNEMMKRDDEKTMKRNDKNFRFFFEIKIKIEHHDGILSAS